MSALVLGMTIARKKNLYASQGKHGGLWLMAYG